MNAHLSNGNIEDATEYGTFSTQDTSVVSIEGSSLIGVSPGSAEISVLVQVLTLDPLGETSGSLNVTDDAISYTSLEILSFPNGTFYDVTQKNV